jgi:hypothetical protein
MKIIVHLDSGQYLELTPDQLTLSSSSETGCYSLGVHILVSVPPNEDGTPNPNRRAEFFPLVDFNANSEVANEGT